MPHKTRPPRPHASLLTYGAWARVAATLLPLALLWAAVAWALQTP